MFLKYPVERFRVSGMQFRWNVKEFVIFYFYTIISVCRIANPIKPDIRVTSVVAQHYKNK